MNLQSPPIGVSIDLYNSSTTQTHQLGAKVVDRQGRTFRYAKAGGSALVAGNVLQAPAQITTHQAMTPSATAIAVGAAKQTVSATLGATNAVTANQYAGGFLVVSTGPGNGYAYEIESHPAASASAACVFTLAEPLKVALTTSSRVDLVPNNYNGVIQTPVTTLTGAPVGVATFPAAASEFCWIQTGGVAPTLVAGTPAVGAAVVVPATAAGAVVVDGAATATIVVGVMCQTGVDGKNLAVKINFE